MDNILLITLLATNLFSLLFKIIWDWLKNRNGGVNEKIANLEIKIKEHEIMLKELSKEQTQSINRVIENINSFKLEFKDIIVEQVNEFKRDFTSRDHCNTIHSSLNKELELLRRNQ